MTASLPASDTDCADAFLVVAMVVFMVVVVMVVLIDSP